MTDVRMFAKAMYAIGIGQEYSYIVEHGSLFDEINI